MQHSNVELIPGNKYEVIAKSTYACYLREGDRFTVHEVDTDNILVDVLTKGQYNICPSFYTFQLVEDNTMSFTQQQKADAQKQLATLKAEMEKLEGIINAPEKNVLDILDCGYFVNSCADVDEVAHDQSKIGNSFKEKAHAEAFAQQFKIWCLVNSRAAILANGWKPDWNDERTNKYVIYFNHTLNKFETECRGWCDQFLIAMSTRENGQQVAGWLNQHVTYNNGTWLLVKPDTDLDSRFKAWDSDMQEYINVNGWLFTFEGIV